MPARTAPARGENIAWSHMDHTTVATEEGRRGPGQPCEAPASRARHFDRGHVAYGHEGRGPAASGSADVYQAPVCEHQGVGPLPAAYAVKADGRVHLFPLNEGDTAYGVWVLCRCAEYSEPSASIAC